jgi:hypothetical protein
VRGGGRADAKVCAAMQRNAEIMCLDPPIVCVGFREVLLACAMAEKDSLGRFSAVNVCPPLEQITGKAYSTGAFQSHLTKFTEEKRGPVLKRTGSRRNYRWQFLNPQLIPFVRLHGIELGLPVRSTEAVALPTVL